MFFIIKKIFWIKLWLIAIAVYPNLSHAQLGFIVFNQRNHPELKWEVIETEHFKIIYHQRLEKTAKRAAAISEMSHKVITANLEFAPSNKIAIYITDQDEISNGYDLGSAYIAIWVNVNNYLEWSTGSDKWLRKVIAHELVHYIHYSAIRTWLGFIGEGLSGTPRWFAEGLAQYESETWNIHRGDQMLRTAVMDDELDFRSGRFPSDGALMYAAGNSMVRYIAAHYGDDKLVQLLRHRSRRIVPYYRFGNAFRHTFKKTFKQFYREWRRSVNVYYNAYHEQKEDIDEIGRKIEMPLKYIYGFRIAPDSSCAALIGFDTIDERSRKLYIVKLDSSQKRRILDHNSVYPQISWAPDASQIIYAKTHRAKYGALAPDLYIVSLDGKKRRITTNLRAADPDWSPDGKTLVCVANQHGTANLIRLTVDGNQVEALTHFRGDVQIRQPRWSPDGKWIAFVLSDTSGQRDIAVISNDGKIFLKITNDSFDDRNPCWAAAAKKIAFTSYRNGIANLYTKNLEGSPQKWVWQPAYQFTDVAEAPYLVDWMGDSVIVRVNRSRYETTLYALAASREVGPSSVHIKPKYTNWQSHRPPHGLPRFHVDPAFSPKIEKEYSYHSFRYIRHFFTVPLPLVTNGDFGISFATLWAEPLGKHTFIGMGDIYTKHFSDSRYLFSYVNNQWHPTIALSTFYFPLSAQIYDDQVLIEEKRGASLQLFLPFNFGDNLFSNHRLVCDFTWSKNIPINLDDFLNPTLKPESKSIGGMGIGYQWRNTRPNRQNIIHPRNGFGVMVRASFADKAWKSDLTYQKYELDSYFNLPVPLMDHILFLRGKAQAVRGEQLRQESIGFDQYDQLDFGLGLSLGERDRLRGIHEYILGDRLLMFTAEYRFGLISNLGWYLAGIRFGRLTGALFSDNGAVWRHTVTPLEKITFLHTAGFELKNQVSVGGFAFIHCFGWAWQLSKDSKTVEKYYRIRAVVPF